MTRINTNVQSLIARRAIAINNASLSKALERLSTGLRINTGKDDPAGEEKRNRVDDQPKQAAILPDGSKGLAAQDDSAQDNDALRAGHDVGDARQPGRHLLYRQETAIEKEQDVLDQVGQRLDLLEHEYRPWPFTANPARPEHRSGSGHRACA